MVKPANVKSNDSNTESPSSYGKEAYKEYRKKEKLKEESGTLGNRYFQKRSKIVLDKNYARSVAQILKDFRFPANKERLIQFMLDRHTSRSNEVTDVLSLVQQVQEKEYKSVADLIDAIGLLKDVS
jgi:Protein of unknown function (DUF2795)